MVSRGPDNSFHVDAQIASYRRAQLMFTPKYWPTEISYIKHIICPNFCSKTSILLEISLMKFWDAPSLFIRHTTLSVVFLRCSQKSNAKLFLWFFGLGIFIFIYLFIYLLYLLYYRYGIIPGTSYIRIRNFCVSRYILLRNQSLQRLERRAEYWRSSCAKTFRKCPLLF